MKKLNENIESVAKLRKVISDKHGFSDLFDVWDETQLNEFLIATEEFEKIDETDWK